METSTVSCRIIYLIVSSTFQSSGRSKITSEKPEVPVRPQNMDNLYIVYTKPRHAPTWTKLP